MQKLTQSLLWLVVSLFAGTRPALSADLSDGLTWLSPAETKALWKNYCVTDAQGSPRPNYKSKALSLDGQAIAQAYVTISRKFDEVADISFYLYDNVVRAHRIRAEAPPQGVNRNAHEFLSYLCGEFRDRPQMIAAKVQWTKTMNKLPAKVQKPIPLRDKDGLITNVWHHMTARAYYPFLSLSLDLWLERLEETSLITMGKYTEPAYVLGMSVCAVRVMFNEYIANNRTFKTPHYSYRTFKKLLATYESDPELCAPGEKHDFYNFRGDSNFKPNTPEGNGMIWYANSLLAHCTETKTAKPVVGPHADPNLVPTDADCADYFENPFRRRWQAARAGLATWMLYAPRGQDRTNFERYFRNEFAPIIVLPHRMNASQKKRPFAFQFKQNASSYEEWLPGFEPNRHFEEVDFGFRSPEIAQLEASPGKANLNLTFERLRDAVNRHTQWYESQWDDRLDTPQSFKTQAYSPFVASSYEPSQSDQFTYCGTTVPCPPDGFKHWMFVFRVKGQHIYSTDKVGLALPFNFSTDWFDETSLGTTGLADQERAWDRLGTAMEEELAHGAILYLHNISDTGKVVGDER